MSLTKKLTTWILMLVMVLSLIPQTVFAESAAEQTDELNSTITLKGATFFDGSPWSGTTQTIREYGREVPYNGWQLMKLIVEVPFKDGLEVTKIQPSTESLYPEYSELKKDDKNSKWVYDFYFYDNGAYTFTIDYSLNGKTQSLTKSYEVKGLVSIKDAAMRRHLIHNYGELSGLSHQGGQYITEEFLATPLYDPWGNLSFDFGKDTDNGSTAQYTKSLDGLQYLTNIHGMYLYNCRNLDPGESLATIADTYYPMMKIFRVSNINTRPNMPSTAYNGKLVEQCISNMPALGELVINGTGFSDCSVFRDIKEGGLYYLQAMANNIVNLDGIESQANLSSVNIGQNQIKSIEPLSKLNNIDFVNLTRNQVFDLTPINDNFKANATPGSDFGGQEQNITYEKTVATTLANDEYTVELPMPIDIDGRLTDTSEVKVKYANGTTKSYKTKKLDGKTYIYIPKTDVDSNKDNPFEKANFSFSFNNNNGTDSRTKGYFTGTLSFKVNPNTDQFRAAYEFVSGTNEKNIPKEVTDLLPVDNHKYQENDTINAIKPAKTAVEVADGSWTFEGYDADSKVANTQNADANNNVKFTGTWKFNKNASIINEVPTINAADKTISVGDEFDPLDGVAATDKEDGEIKLTLENVIENEVDTATPGVYKVTYKVTDSMGAASVLTINITVKANAAPVDPNKPIIPDTSVNDKNPQTGDSTNMILWTILLITSGIGFIGVYRKQKKTNQ